MNCQIYLHYLPKVTDTNNKPEKKNVLFCKKLGRYGPDPAQNLHRVILWYSPQLRF